MPSELQDVNTLEETAAYLRLTPKRVSQMALARRLSGIKEGRRWIFTREAIRAYLDANSPVPVPGDPVVCVRPRPGGRVF